MRISARPCPRRTRSVVTLPAEGAVFQERLSSSPSLCCCASVYAPVPQSSYATKSSRMRPAVMHSSPTLRMSSRTVELRGVLRGGVAGVGGQRRLLEGVHGVTESVLVDVLSVDLNFRRGVERRAQAVGHTGGGDPERRRVDDSLQDERIAYTPDGACGDQPLVHYLHAGCASGPQRVDHGLHVLLVDDEIVGAGVTGDPPVAWRVVQGDAYGPAAHRGEPGQCGQAVGVLLRGAYARVSPTGLTAELVDLPVQVPVGVLGLLVTALLLGDQLGDLRTAAAAQVGPVRGARAGGEKRAGEQRESRDGVPPGDRP